MNRDASKRVFVTIDLPDVIKRRLQEAQEKAGRLARPLRLVEPANLHFTLLFLGSQPVVNLPRISRLLKNLAHETPVFELRTANFGFFRAADSTLSWHLSLFADDNLLALRDKLVQRLAAESFRFPADRVFRPHITLGRFRLPGSARNIEGKIPAETGWSESFAANYLSLLESDLKFCPPKYHLLYSYPLVQSS